MSRKAFVTGVTGTQGGAVAKQLIRKGWEPHAVIRSKHAGTATYSNLETAGVKLTMGDWDDKAALKAALDGCTALFMAMMPDFQDADRELVQAQRTFTLAREAGVQTAVVSTGTAANELSIISSWGEDSLVARFMMSKYRIEEAVKTAGFASHTILRPAFFMANFLLPKVAMYQGLHETGRWTLSLRPDSWMPMVDDSDIAQFAVAAMEDPARFNGKGIALASELKTPDMMLAALSHAAGRELKAVYLTDEEIEGQRGKNRLVEAYLVMREMDKRVDMKDAKSYGIPMSTFEVFLEREKEAVKKTYG